LRKSGGQAWDIAIEENGGNKFLMLVIENRLSSIGGIWWERVNAKKIDLTFITDLTFVKCQGMASPTQK
jgi:hypothetical protein